MVKDKNFGERTRVELRKTRECASNCENYVTTYVEIAQNIPGTFEVSNNIRVTSPALRVSKCNEFRSFSPSNFPSLSARRLLPIAIDSEGSQEK